MMKPLQMPRQERERRRNGGTNDDLKVEPHTYRPTTYYGESADRNGTNNMSRDEA